MQPLTYINSNVDRLLATWQALNPKKWFDNLDPDESGPTASLSPFHKDTHGTVYNSNDIRDWTKLNYQYDTLENTPRWIRAQGTPVTPDNIVQHVRRTVNMSLNASRHAVLSAPASLQGTTNDYIINVIYDRYGLDGKGYTIHFFISPEAPVLSSQTSSPSDSHGQTVISSSTTTPSTSNATISTTHAVAHPAHLGTISTFSSSLELNPTTSSKSDSPTPSGACSNCIAQAKSGVLSKSLLILTPKLVSHALDPEIPAITTLNPSQVTSYLASHLTWSVVEVGSGRIVDIARELPKTKVFVLGGTAAHYEDPGRCSEYDGYECLWGATEGKTDVGGAVRADEDLHNAV